MMRELTVDEFNFVKKLGTEDELIDFGEFLALELLRLGRVDRDTLALVKAEFQKRDQDGSGEITWDEIVAFQKQVACARSLRARITSRLLTRRGSGRGACAENHHAQVAQARNEAADEAAGFEFETG